MSSHSSGLHTAIYNRLHLLKDGEHTDVSTPGGGGGGGDTTELVTRLSSVEATLPQKAAPSTVTAMSGSVTLKADHSAFNELSDSRINHQAHRVFASESGVLHKLDKQLPLMMTTHAATNSVRLQVGDLSQLASPASLGSTTLSDDAGLRVDVARARTGSVALDATSHALQVQLAPDDATSPTWAPTKMAVTPRWSWHWHRRPSRRCSATCGGICSNRRRRLSQPSCSGSLGANHNTEQLGMQRSAAPSTIRIDSRANAPQHGQPHCSRNSTGRMCVCGSHMASRAGELCKHAHRLLRRCALCVRAYSGWNDGSLDGEVRCY